MFSYSSIAILSVLNKEVYMFMITRLIENSFA